jgi:hypothetical protein
LSYNNWQNEFHFETSQVNSGINEIVFEESKWCESGLLMLLFLPLCVLVSILTFPFNKNLYCDGKKPYKEKLLLRVNIKSNIDIIISDASPSLKDSCCTLSTVLVLTNNPSGSSNIVSTEYTKVKCSKKGVSIWIISQVFWTGAFCTLLFLFHITLIKAVAIIIFVAVFIWILYNAQ